MKEATALHSSLLDPPQTSLAQSDILSAFWNYEQHTQRLNCPDVNFDAYWSYYSKECSRALHDGGRHVAMRSHGDIVDCVQLLKANVPREGIKETLRTKLTSFHPNEEEMLDNSIDLSASVLLMLGFCSYSYGFSGRSRLCWAKGSLRDYVETYFNPVHITKEVCKLEKIFNARNLVRIAGLEVIWTDNLVDHLQLTDDDKCVHIFHHASFLEAQKQSSDSLLPDGLADETLRTLALLLPSDLKTRKWISRLTAGQTVDKQLTSCGRLTTKHRQIDQFKYWGERLVTLKQVFDEAQPQSLSQWWHDRRNGVQWYTFWVAVSVLILTVFFGIVQSIEGGLQVYASFRGLK